MVSPIVIAVSVNSAPFSIVVVPLPGSPAPTGSRSMPPTLSGSFAPFNSSAYTSRSLIAWPTSLPSKLPKFRVPSTTVLPVAASTVNLPRPIFKLPLNSVLPSVSTLKLPAPTSNLPLSLVSPLLTVKPPLSTDSPPLTDKPPLVTAKLPATDVSPVTDKPF